MINAYRWIGKGGLRNFGDIFNELLLSALHVDVNWTTPKKADLVVTGSILEHLPSHWAGTVCGAGLLRPESRIDLSDANVVALRGLYTKVRTTGVPDDVVLGDPGLLAPMVNPEQPAFYDLGVLPHWSDKELAGKFGYGHIIDPTDPPAHVIAEITRCKRLVSSSLHGIIIADAYGIPRQAEMFPQASKEGGAFKFWDYASVFDVAPYFGEMWRPPAHKVAEIQARLWAALMRALGLPAPPTFPPPPTPPPTGDVPQISLLVPFRGGNEHRERTWNWLATYWLTHLPSAEIVMGWSTTVPFSKSEAVNYAAERARGRIFVVLDADAFLDWQALQKCADDIDAAVKAGKRLWFMPYDRLYRLNEQTTIDMLQTDPYDPHELLTARDRPPIEWLESGSPNAEFYGHQYGAMMQVMPREAFFTAGGMDQRFVGWGSEDASLLRAIDTLYGQHELAHNLLLHFWHEHRGKDWKTREWVGQLAPGVAKPHLAKRYGQATGEPAFMRALAEEHQGPTVS